MTTVTDPELALRQLGVMSPDDIDIEAIAYSLGAFVDYKVLGGCEAYIVGDGDRATISVNSKASIGRRRFSAAHELGHWAWDRGKVRVVRCSHASIFQNEVRGQNREVVANRYAANLLMPRYLFEPMANEVEIVIESTRVLADRFRTSLTATALRLVMYSGRPAGWVLLDEVGHVKRCFLNKEVPETFSVHRSLDPESGANNVVKGVVTQTGPTTVHAGCWIDATNANEYELVEDSIRVWENMTLVLLWWQDESHVAEFWET